MTQCNDSECPSCRGTGSTRTGPSCSPEGCACEWEPCERCGGTGYLSTVFTLGQLEDLAAYVADAEGVATVAVYVTAEKVLHADLRDEHGLSVDKVAIHAALPGERYKIQSTGERTCPRCGMTSYHPTDIREGYCGQCHDWTTPKDPVRG